MRPLRDEIQKELKRLHLWTAGKSASTPWKDLPVFQQIGRVSKAVQAPRLEDTLLTGGLLAFMSELAEGALACPQGVQLLLSLPNQGEWSWNGLNWHLDVTPDAHDRLPGIQAFFLIDDVAPRGGATLALAGSHRPDARRAARAILRDAADALPVAELQRMGLEVMEMAGRAGDVVLMDLRVLHTPSVNTDRRVRMMATARCFL